MQFPIHQRMRIAVYEFFRALAAGVNKTKVFNSIFGVLRLPENQPENQEYELSSPEFLDLVTGVSRG